MCKLTTSVQRHAKAVRQAGAQCCQDEAKQNPASSAAANAEDAIASLHMMLDRPYVLTRLQGASGKLSGSTYVLAVMSSVSSSLHFIADSDCMEISCTASLECLLQKFVG